jgi:hypothetical protein
MNKGNIIAIILTILLILIIMCYIINSMVLREGFLPVEGGTIDGNLRFLGPSKLVLNESPTEDNHATNKQYVDQATIDNFKSFEGELADAVNQVSFDNMFIPLKGGQMSGDLIIDRNLNVPLPMDKNDAINKGYLDQQDKEKDLYFQGILKNLSIKDDFLPVAGGTLKGDLNALNIGLDEPILETHLANKSYVDKVFDDSVLDKLKQTASTSVDISQDLIDMGNQFKGQFVPLSGGIMKGDVKVSNVYLTSPSPNTPTSLTSKKDVDTLMINFKQIQTDKKDEMKKVIDDKVAKDFGMYLSIKGGTMKGSFKVPSITIIDPPEQDTSLVNKEYLDPILGDIKLDADSDILNNGLSEYLNKGIKQRNDDANNKYLSLSGGTVTGNITTPLITINSPPLIGPNLTNKAYVDKQFSDGKDYVDSAIDKAKKEIEAGVKPEYLPLAGGTMKGNLSVPSLEINTLPKDKTDAASKTFLEAALEDLTNGENFFPFTGGTLKGDLKMVNNPIILNDQPLKGSDLANKAYVDKSITTSTPFPLAGGTMNGSFEIPSITVNKAPSVATDIATVAYAKNKFLTEAKSIAIITYVNEPSFYIATNMFLFDPTNSMKTTSSGVVATLASFITKGGTFRVHTKGSFTVNTTLLIFAMKYVTLANGNLGYESRNKISYTVPANTLFAVEAFVTTDTTYNFLCVFFEPYNWCNNATWLDGKFMSNCVTQQKFTGVTTIIML